MSMHKATVLLKKCGVNFPHVWTKKKAQGMFITGIVKVESAFTYFATFISDCEFQPACMAIHFVNGCFGSNSSSSTGLLSENNSR